jgi:hypothetical protein
MNNSSGKSIPRDGVIFNSVDNGNATINIQNNPSVLFTHISNTIGNNKQRKGIARIK